MKALPCFIAAFFLLAGCSSLGDPDSGAFQAPRIQDVYAAAGANPTEVIIVVRISSMEGIKDYGILFGTNDLSPIPSNNLKDNTFSVVVNQLEWSTEYRYKAYINGGRGQVESALKIWKMQDETPPAAEILKITPGVGSDAGHVTLNCMIRDLSQVSGRDRLRCGVCYSPLKEEPDLDDTAMEAADYTSSGVYTIQLDGLLHGISYFFRPFTRIGECVTYGEPVQQRIPSGEEIIVTGDYSGLSAHSVTLYGKINLEEGVSWNSCVTAFDLNGEAILSEQRDEEGNFQVTVLTLDAENDYTYQAFARIDGKTFSGEKRSFRTPADSDAKLGYVDLGLDVLWATCNLGADSPEEAGDLFAWGETEPKEEYTWENYKWCLGTKETMFKYVDPINRQPLDPDDDAARVRLGGKWRMPTSNDWSQLQYFTQMKKMTVNGTNGYFFSSKIEGYIGHGFFLPIDNHVVGYWVPLSDYIYYAFSFNNIGGSDSPTCRRLDRYRGLPIRPVRDR